MLILLRRIPKSRLALLGLFSQNQHDDVKTPGYEDLHKKYVGMEAVRRMFMTDDYGQWSAELATVVHMSTLSLVIGVLFGGAKHAREAWFNFIDNNQATQFANHLEAKRRLQDEVTQAFGKGALKWSWRIGAFTSMFILTSTIIRVYRGEQGLLEYVTAGAITGGFFKLNLGIKGFISGAAVGGFLGLLPGTVTLLLYYLGGPSMQDLEKVQHDLHVKRNEGFRQMKKNAMKDEFDRLLDENDRAKAVPGKSPLDIIKDEDKKDS